MHRSIGAPPRRMTPLSVALATLRILGFLELKVNSPHLDDEACPKVRIVEAEANLNPSDFDKFGGLKIRL